MQAHDIACEALSLCESIPNTRIFRLSFALIFEQLRGNVWKAGLPECVRIGHGQGVVSRRQAQTIFESAQRTLVLSQCSVYFTTGENKSQIVRVRSHGFVERFPCLNGFACLNVRQCQPVPTRGCFRATFKRLVCKEIYRRNRCLRQLLANAGLHERKVEIFWSDHAPLGTRAITHVGNPFFRQWVCSEEFRESICTVKSMCGEHAFMHVGRRMRVPARCHQCSESNTICLGLVGSTVFKTRVLGGGLRRGHGCKPGVGACGRCQRNTGDQSGNGQYVLVLRAFPLA